MTLVERLRETADMLARSVGTEADVANVRDAIARIEAADEAALSLESLRLAVFTYTRGRRQVFRSPDGKMLNDALRRADAALNEWCPSADERAQHIDRALVREQDGG